MRAMLSFTIWGALLISIVPCARTAGACIANARPTAAVSVDAANQRGFMTFTSPVASRGRPNRGRFVGTAVGVTGALKNCFLSPGSRWVYSVWRSSVTRMPECKWLTGSRLMVASRHSRGPPLTLLVAPAAEEARRAAGGRDWSKLMARAQDGERGAYRMLLEDLTP